MFLVAALLFAQVMPEQLDRPTPQPSATPAAKAPYERDVVDLEAGGAVSWLNHKKNDWSQAYGTAAITMPSGVKVFTSADDSTRFGSTRPVYGIGMDVPTGMPHGIVDFGYQFSPGSDVLPTHAWFAGYDLRTGGGYGYQFGYVNRSFSTTNADTYTVGFDRNSGDQRFGYFLSVATQSREASSGISQGLQWSKYLPADTIVATASAGRGIESTGRNTVGAHDLMGFDVDEMHWFDRTWGLRLNTGYFSVYRAYQRVSLLLGVHARMR